MSTVASSPRSSGSGSAAPKWLTKATTSPSERPAALVIAGPPGVGKSSLAGNIPGAIAMPFSGEDTWSQLKAIGSVPKDLVVLPPISSYADMLAVINELATETHDYKALIVDTMNVAEKLCHAHVCNRDYKGDMGKNGFQSYMGGYETAATEWRVLLNSLDKLRDKQMRLILLAHTKVKAFKNPLGPDYDRYVVDVHEKTWGVTHGWADAVLFCNYYVAVDESGNRPKGKGGDTRLIHTTYSAAYDGKNRYNLPAEIDMGNSGSEAWGNLVNAIKKGRQ